MTPLFTAHRPARRPVPDALWRQLLTHLLHGTRSALARRRRSQHDVSIEFHAEAGAPEGALYVDGEFVGYIDARRL